MSIIYNLLTQDITHRPKDSYGILFGPSSYERVEKSKREMGAWALVGLLAFGGAYLARKETVPQSVALPRVAAAWNAIDDQLAAASRGETPKPLPRADGLEAIAALTAAGVMAAGTRYTVLRSSE